MHTHESNVDRQGVHSIIFQAVVRLQHQLLDHFVFLRICDLDVINLVRNGGHEKFTGQVVHVLGVKKGHEIFGICTPRTVLFGRKGFGEKSFELIWVIEVGETAGFLFDVNAAIGLQDFTGIENLWYIFDSLG